MTDPELEAWALDWALEAARADYVDDWVRGNLYDDGDVYSRPLEKLSESGLLPDLVSASDDHELLHAAKKVRAALVKYIGEELDLGL